MPDTSPQFIFATMLPESFRTTNHLLRPLSMTDAKEIFLSYAQDPEVSLYTIWMPHKILSDTEEFVSDCLSVPPHISRTYSIYDNKEGGFRGLFSLRQIKSFYVEFGYVLARPWWGRGIMTEVLKKSVILMLSQKECFRISGICDVENLGSARVMEKAGLKREGILRRCIIHPNVSKLPRDCFSYAAVK
ncbi:GNAT family N-acetyltransferase [Gluconacetobacter azotocaptans]|uniref:GNAT family N-acetyltransferase n=1 Tax=Gluconacetobacter azotocaptans TaxID=142834 RepID=UPI00195A0814|nr:GNAT family N-acetyltransferase [Gluconacetobacter azotocaptans]MBM9400098.1 GNAT family N-acetyltransferase [Gluconacetobacter azotocaptans]